MADHAADLPAEDAPVDEAALLRWIDDLGVEGTRRLVRRDDAGILVSKFEPGFAARLHELLDLMPELFEEPSVVAAYREAAASAEPSTKRVDAWHTAMHALLAAAGERHDVPDLRLAEVRTGIDSVRAILDTVIWSEPTVAQEYAPIPGERSAYLDGLAELADGRDLFTRYYGQFEGVPVRNHCPGASFARVMLAQGWTACSGEPPPVAGG
jgi:hypothetical protein